MSPKSPLKNVSATINSDDTPCPRGSASFALQKNHRYFIDLVFGRAQLAAPREYRVYE